KQQVLVDFNKTATDYPKDKTIHQLFEEQVEKTPDRISTLGKEKIKDKREIKDNKKIKDNKETEAPLQQMVANVGGIHESPLSTPSTPSTTSTTSTHKTPSGIQHPASGIQHPASSIQLTYSELNKKATRLARQFQSKGIKPGAIIAIMGERSIDTLIGIIAILKAGGAYLPIDPDYPRERINYMLKDSNAKMLLTWLKETEEIDKIQELKAIGDEVDIIDINTITRPSALPEPRQPEPAPNTPPQSTPAYIMYTSGTTGKPKGVMVEHRNVVRLVKNTNFIRFAWDDRILQTGNNVFDAATFEIWGALLNGLQLVTVDKSTILDSEKLGASLKKHNVTILWL
ncbi:MAG: AMP-binding protein, partial [bacterium]|nr:AMP-binding protein [bacterium]